MDQQILEKYARLVVKFGVNIQKNQTLVLSSPIECAYFARLISEAAYQEGARDVVMIWGDEKSDKIRFKNAPEEVFDEFPSWTQDLYLSTARKNAAYISIAASDPELFKDVLPRRLAAAQKSRKTALLEFNERTMSNRNTWCVISVPTASWAAKVFPGMPEDQALSALWDAILQAVRADQPDPAAAWELHKGNLKKSLDFLNGHRFKYLKYRNSLGTDVQIELPDNHVWLGGSDYTPEGLEFIANLPTEEVFTLPKRDGVNGTVVSSMPLNHNGNLIDGFSLTFSEGRVTSFLARQGYEVLKSILDTDEGSSFLGEVALVPYDSPISNTGILFYNTLFDENASCHLALGKAYPVSIQGGEDMTREQLDAAGANNSLTHADFMVGTADLSIIGIRHDGSEIPVFVEGNFAF